MLWVATLPLFGAYSARSIGTGSDEFRKVLNAGFSLTAGLAILSYAVNVELSREYLLLAMPTLTGADLCARSRGESGCTGGAPGVSACPPC